MKQSYRVLLVAEGEAVRAPIRAAIAADPGLVLVGEAAGADAAIDAVTALDPDVVAVALRVDADVAVIHALMVEAPRRVIGVPTPGASAGLGARASEAGAMEIVPRALPRWEAALCEAVRLMAEVPFVRRRRSSSSSMRAVRTLDVFGIVASTGGPPALARILGRLPADLSFPILVVQHITDGFTRGLARMLADATQLAITIAEAGMPAEPGHVYLAPDGRDIEIGPRLALRVPEGDRDRAPSGDRLLASLAASCGARAGGVVLTGMGADGAAGLQALRDKGGVTAAQDEATSVVYGMPKAARDAAAHVLALDDVAPFIAQHALQGATNPLVRGKRW